MPYSTGQISATLSRDTVNITLNSSGTARFDPGPLCQKDRPYELPEAGRYMYRDFV